MQAGAVAILSPQRRAPAGSAIIVQREVIDGLMPARNAGPVIEQRAQRLLDIDRFLVVLRAIAFVCSESRRANSFVLTIRHLPSSESAPRER
jgi:hypothetical protein